MREIGFIQCLYLLHTPKMLLRSGRPLHELACEQRIGDGRLPGLNTQAKSATGRPPCGARLAQPVTWASPPLQ